MTSRERVRVALNHKEPDRVPIDVGGNQSGISYETYMGIKEMLGIKSETKIVEFIQGLAKVDEEALRLWNVDTRYIYQKPPYTFQDPFVREDGEFTDKYGIKWWHSFYTEWGTKWHRPSSSRYYDIFGAKLKNVKYQDLDAFPWPKGGDPGRDEGLEKEVKELYENTEYAIFFAGPSIFEHSWEIYGLEEYLLKMADEPKYIEKLYDKILESHISVYGKFLDTAGPYLDCMELYNDLGTQVGPFISPKYYANVIKPREKKLIQFLKTKTKAKIFIHSCGSVYEFIPDIIDAGYDGLHPVQTTASKMDPKVLKKEFGKDLLFWGAIDTQKALPFGTEEDVRQSVRKMIGALGPNGGYILAPCHNILALVPPQNVLAMFDEAIKYGKYPLAR
jgi:uroporphyrinogen decarboxylase